MDWPVKPFKRIT